MIRLARPEDAQEIAQIYAPVVRDTHTSFELEAPDADEMRARIVKTLAMFPWLVMEREGRVAGYAYASRHRERRAYQWSVDVSCYVRADARGQGVGAALYRALLKVLREQGFQTAYAGVSLPNDASIRLHQSVGFLPVGIYREAGYKNGAWRDTSWMQCRIGDAVADPPEPTPLPQLRLGVLDQL
jgi:L-amino acid N-acyltransferase YncA